MLGDFHAELPLYSRVKLEVMAVGPFTNGHSDKLDYLRALQLLSKQTISSTAQHPHFSRNVFQKSGENKRGNKEQVRVLQLNFVSTTMAEVKRRRFVEI